ncbi:MAG: ABC transporter ATP-binding protein [Candidatus Bathyarchaeia archaeon]
MPTIEVQNLYKEYCERQVLRDVSFTVQHGEIFVLVGPNGAGKTTLLRIIDLLEEPTSGRVIFDGELVDYSANEKVNFRRLIGMVFQRTVLFNMNVFDNIAYPLKIRGEEKCHIKDMVKAVLELLQLKGFEHKNALSLSGGEAQRVAIAQALVAEPQLLLLDEPTANLDPRNASIVEEAISSFNRERKTTIIMTTHNMSQAENLASRAAILSEGKIERIGTFQEVFSNPSKTIRDFARLENVFQGISRITGEGTSIIDIGGGLQIEAAFKKTGNVMVHVPPEDIILSNKPLISSARNAFEGSIAQISDMGDTVKLRVRAGKYFTVQITKRSFNEMQLNLNSRVYLAFKASSVQTS